MWLSSMKTGTDPRHRARQHLVAQLFALSFHTQKNQSEELQQIFRALPTIDELITKAAPEWPLDKIARIDLAILRLAVYELTQKDTPPKVVIDEAVELAKSYGGDTSPSFVNGVLGTIYGWLHKKEDTDESNQSS